MTARIRKASLLSLAVVLAMAFAAAPASATKTFGFSFGSQGTLGGQFASSSVGNKQIAVNQTGAGGVAPGTLYVTDPANVRVESFDANGNFLRAWGRDVVQSGKAEDTGTGFEICLIAANCQAGLAGEGAGEFQSSGKRPIGGIAVDQSNGHVYVFDAGNFRVEEFDPTGHFIRAWGDDVTSAGPGNTGANEQQKLTVKATKGAFSLSPVTAESRGIETPGSNVITGIEPTLGAFRVGDSIRGRGITKSTHTTITAVGPGTLTVSHNAEEVESGSFLYVAEENTGAEGEGNLTEGSTAVTGLATYSGAFAVGETISGEGIPGSTTIASCSPACGPAATSLTLSKAVAAGKTATGVELTGNDIPFAATHEELQAHLDALPGIGPSGVTASGGPGSSTGSTPYTVAFSGGPLAGNDIEAMESSIAGLGGAGKGATVETTVPGGGPEICNPGAGDTCKAGVQATGGGEFVRIEEHQFGNAGAGVDSTGNVYIGDAGNARVQKFDSTGHFLAAGGWDVDKANPSTEYEVCTVAVNCKVGIAGSGAGQFAAEELFLAVAPSGDVYASNNPAKKVFHLSSSLAFDPSFAPAAGLSGGLSLATGTGDGHLFVASASDGGLFYEIEPGTGALLQADPAKNVRLAGALAVNSATGRLYAGDEDVIDVYAEGPTLPVPAALPATAIGPGKATLNGHAYPNGTALTECAFEYLPEAEYIAHSQSFAGAAVKACSQTPAEIGAVVGPVAVAAEAPSLAPATKYVYRLALANINGRRESSEQFFTTLANLTLSATTTAPSAIGAHKATLNGTVNPQGQALTECVFEWGRTAAYEEAPVPCTAPSAAEVLPDSNPHAVHATIAGLALGSEYHYRLRAANAETAAHGADEPILTLGPTLGASWSEGVTLREATLKAEIDPQGSATTYRFEYGTAPYAEGEAPHGASVPIPPGAVGADGATHTVAASIEGLHPATTYHYRVIAESECEAAQRCLKEGPDRELTTYAEPSSSDGCPNAPFRVGPGAALPDCRAYEMVSPVDKGGGDIVAAERPGAGSTAFTQAAIEGGRITYTSSTNFGDAQRGAYAAQYLATRGAGGWSTEGIDAPQGTTVFDPAFNDAVDLQNAFQAFTPDLCHALMVDQNLIPLTEDAIHGYTDTYWRDNCGAGAGSYEAVTTGAPPTSSGYGPSLNSQARNYSLDHGNVIFTTESALTPNAAPGNENNAQIYDFSAGGARHLVSLLPDGQASTAFNVVGAGSRAHDSTLSSAVSSDASRVFWNAGDVGGSPRGLYLRLNPSAEETSAKDGAGNCVPDPVLACTVPISDNARFWAADPQGETAIYSAGASLFEYDVATETKTKIADEAGGVVGASANLSRLYFTSEEAIPDSGQNEQGEEASEGQVNLYLREGGQDTFIATLASADSGHGGNLSAGIDSASPQARRSRLSPDGAHLAFTSKSAALAHSVAHYDNTDQATGEADNEVYLYDAETGKLACASCNPTGARPAGATWPTPTAAYIPGWQWSNNASRVLSSDGSRLFFNSFDSLAPADTNGRLDVYEWEAPGTGPVGGRCAESSPSFSARDGGCLNLISTGRSQSPSSFVDASADGRDAFISTDSSIDPRDPGLIDIYDAREGGGFPPPPPEAPECAGDACQSVPAAPRDPTPASSSYRGAGNVTEEAPAPAPCAKGKVKRQGRCVAQKHRKRAHKRHRRRAAQEQGEHR